MRFMANAMGNIRKHWHRVDPQHDSGSTEQIGQPHQTQLEQDGKNAFGLDPFFAWRRDRSPFLSPPPGKIMKNNAGVKYNSFMRRLLILVKW